jgi:hypothetical protein
MIRRASLTGISTNAPDMRGVTQNYDTRNSIPLPSGSISRIEPTLERGHVSQALLDISALLYLLLFGVSVTLSIPLALCLLIFARF